MSDKHTRGKWEADRRSTHAGQIATIHGSQGGWIEIWSTDWPDTDNQEANASLILAAPKLLDALKLARNDLACLLEFDIPVFARPDDAERVRRLVAAADTALAAAATPIPAAKLRDEGSFKDVAGARGRTDFSLTVSGKYHDEALQALHERYEAELSEDPQ